LLFFGTCLLFVNGGQIMGSVNKKYWLVPGLIAEDDMLLGQANLCLTLSPFTNWNWRDSYIL
jgi:hypothetical protein